MEKFLNRLGGETRGLEVDEGNGGRVLWGGHQKACAATYKIHRTGKWLCGKISNMFTYKFCNFFLNKFFLKKYKNWVLLLSVYASYLSGIE